MSSVITFNKTCQFLRKFIDITTMKTAITYPKSLLDAISLKEIVQVVFT